ncbi:MAG: hypothetical protein ACK559_28585, partial [bacterium]
LGGGRVGGWVCRWGPRGALLPTPVSPSGARRLRWSAAACSPGGHAAGRVRHSPRHWGLAGKRAAECRRGLIWGEEV